MTWRRPLDTIIHNGALVNHAFTYEQLFEPNVLGSLQVTIPCEFVTAMANIRYWEHDGQLHAFCHTWFWDCSVCLWAVSWKLRLSAMSMRMSGMPYSLHLPLQVMKLAVQHRRKALAFVSSVGVASPLGITDTIQEDTLGTDLATEFPASGGYAYG